MRNKIILFLIWSCFLASFELTVSANQPINTEVKTAKKHTFWTTGKKVCGVLFFVGAVALVGKKGLAIFSSFKKRQDEDTVEDEDPLIHDNEPLIKRTESYNSLDKKEDYWDVKVGIPGLVPYFQMLGNTTDFFAIAEVTVPETLNTYDRMVACLHWGAFGDALGDLNDRAWYKYETTTMDQNELFRLGYDERRFGYDERATKCSTYKDTCVPDTCSPVVFSARSIPKATDGLVWISDDTCMTKVNGDFLADESITRFSDLQIINSIANQYIEHEDLWQKGGLGNSRSPGKACVFAMRSLKEYKECKGDQGHSIIEQVLKKPIGPNQGGNGSIMRAAPFGLRFYKDPSRAAQLASLDARLTHGHPIAIGSSAGMAYGVALALQGKTPDDITGGILCAINKHGRDAAGNIGKGNPDYWPESLKTLDKKQNMDLEQMVLHAEKQGKLAHEAYYGNKVEKYNEICTKFFESFRGWGADTALADVIFLLHTFPDDPRKAVLTAVNVPFSDADTIGSITGNLIGARTGWVLPSDEVIGGRLELRDDLTRIAYGLDQAAGLEED